MTTIDQAISPMRPAESADQAQRLRALVREIVDGSPSLRTAPPITSPEPAKPGAAVISIASGKGGVGKTTLTVNLAIALVQRGLRVVVLDGDLGLGNTDVLCGLSPNRTLADCLTGQAALEDIFTPAPGGFTLIPGASGVTELADLDGPRRDRLISALASVEASCDVLLIDCGAGIGGNVTSFIAASDLALVVATPDPASITDAYALIKVALSAASASRSLAPETAPVPSIALVVNNAADRAEALAVHRRIEAVAYRFLGQPVPLAGCVLHSPGVNRATRRRVPVILDTPSDPSVADVRDLSGFAAAVCGVSVDETARKPGLLARLLRVLPRR